MDKIEKIRQEIERRIKLYDGNNTQEMWIGNTYRAVLSFLDTLSEEPDKSLEEAAEEYRRESFKKSVTPQIDGPVGEYGGNIKSAFIAGWKCRDDHMLKEAVECEVTDVGLNYLDLALFDAESLELKDGDKVRIIVLKDNEDESK